MKYDPILQSSESLAISPVDGLWLFKNDRHLFLTATNNPTAMYLPWYWMKMMDDVGFDKDDVIFEQPCCEL